MAWRYRAIAGRRRRSFASPATPHDWIETDTSKGDTATSAFQALNPQAEVPVVVLADGAVFTQSNAILAHIAEATPWLPPSGLPRTRVLEWLFWQQYRLEPSIVVACNLITYRNQREAQAERPKICAPRGNKAVDIMEQRLCVHDWLTVAGPMTADLALFASTHVADEGKFDLARVPGVKRWIVRVTALPGIVELPRP